LLSIKRYSNENPRGGGGAVKRATLKINLLEKGFQKWKLPFRKRFPKMEATF